MSSLGPSQTGIADAVKAFLFTIDPSFDSKDLTLESLETVLPAILANQSISSSTMTQFKDTFYPDADTVRAQGNKTLERIKSQNLQENFKNAKMLFIIAKALYSKLRRDAQARAAQDAFNKKVEKYLRLRKAGNQLALGRYWEELAEFDRIGEEQLLELIKRQHQEAMEQLRGIKATIKILKFQIRDLEQQKERILDFHSKRISEKFKEARLKDGTLLFEGVSDETRDAFSKEFAERKIEGRRKEEESSQEIANLKEEIASLEKRIQEDAHLSIAKDQEKKRNLSAENKEKHSDELDGLFAARPLLTLKTRKDSERAHPLASRLENIKQTLSQKEENHRAIIEENRDVNIQFGLCEKFALKEVANRIRANEKDVEEIIARTTHDGIDAIDNGYKECDLAIKERKAEISECVAAGKEILANQKDAIKGFREGFQPLIRNSNDILRKTETLLEVLDNSEKDVDNFDFEDDDDLEHNSKEKTRLRR